MELEGEEPLRSDRQEESDGASTEVPVGDRDARDLADGDGGDGEVMAGETEARIADRKRERASDQRSRDHPDPRREAGVLREERGGVCAGAEEDRLSEGHLARESTEEVPGVPEQRVEHDENGEVLRVGSAEDEGESQRGGGEDGEGDLHCFPRRPRGRTSMTTR